MAEEVPNSEDTENEDVDADIQRENSVTPTAGASSTETASPPSWKQTKAVIIVWDSALIIFSSLKPLYPIMASMFEFYDFGILGFYSAEIGNVLFPPSLSPLQHSFAIYALFWSSFAARPLGGIVFGHIADVVGRTIAFRYSLYTMAIATLLTGCIPTFQSVGYLSPISLLLFRLLLGVSTGGEISSAFVFIFESAPSLRRALWMSLLSVSSLGVLLSFLVKLAMEYTLTQQQIDAFGWRLPFGIGIFIALIGVYSKCALEETPVFEQMKETETAGKIIGWRDVVDGMALKVAFCEKLGITLVVIGASALNQMTPYLFCVFMPGYLKSAEMHGWSDQNAYRNNLVLMLIGCAAVVMTGYVSDQYGAFRFLVFSAVITTFISPAIWYGFTMTTTEWQDFLLSVPGVVFGYMTAGGLYYWFMDRVVTEPRTRCRIFGVAYNIGTVLFGGTAPFLGSTFMNLWDGVYGSIAIGGWSSTMAVISLICYLCNRHRLRLEFEHFHSEIMKQNTVSRRVTVTAVDMSVLDGMGGMDMNASNEEITENTEFILPQLPPLQPPRVTLRGANLTIPPVPDSIGQHEEQISTVEWDYFDQMKAEMTEAPRQSMH